MRSTSVSMATRILLMTGILGAEKWISISFTLSFSAAGFIKLEWKGADTGKSKARLAPLALSTSQALSTAALLPAMTVCMGSLKLTASTTSEVSGPKDCTTSAHPSMTLAVSYTHLRAHETDSYLVC